MISVVNFRTKPALVLLVLLSCAIGALSAVAQEPASPDLSSPRATVTTFLAAMNDVEAEQPDRMAAALACLNLEGVPTAERDAAGPACARYLFEILDNQTIVLEELPEETPNREITIFLTLLGEDKKLTLRLSNQDQWRFTASVEEIRELHNLMVERRAETAIEVNEEDKVDPRLASPRATMRTFIEGMNRWEDGGEEDVLASLDLSEIAEGVRRERGTLFAEQLKDILDHFPVVLYQTIPDAAEMGDKETHSHVLDDDTQLVLHKVRAEKPAERVWKFSPGTLDNLQATYDYVRSSRTLQVESTDGGPKNTALRVRNWVDDNFPSLTEVGFVFEHWQWIGLATVILAGMAISRLFVFVVMFFLVRLFRRGKLEMDQQAQRQVNSFARPVRLMFMAWVWLVGLRLLNLDSNIYTVLNYAAVTITYGGAIWAGWSLIGLVGSYMRARAESTTNRFDDLLVPLVVRSLKIFVVVAGGVAIIAAISPESYTQLLAGLGIGGLAFALAAKDTIANVFGSMMIIADRPFEIGDWIQVGDIDGSVESVGIRSTRVRTFYNSLITIPNSELTNATIDNYGKRKYRRIKTTLGLTYDTPPEQIEAFCEGVRQLILEHPYTRKDYFHVYLNEFSAYSLDVMLYCFVQTPEWGTELREKHRLFADVLRLAERLGVEFAFPTETSIVRMDKSEEIHAAEVAATSPKSTFDAKRAGRKHAVTIVEDTIGRGMKPPPVDYAAQITDGDELLDAHKGGSTEDDDGGGPDGD